MTHLTAGSAGRGILTHLYSKSEIIYVFVGKKSLKSYFECHLYKSQNVLKGQYMSRSSKESAH